MKKVFLIIFLLILSSKVFAEKPIRYNLNDCRSIIGDTIINLAVDLEMNRVTFSWDVRGDIIRTTTSIQSIENDEVIADPFIYRKISNPNLWYNKWAKIAFDNTTIQLIFNPENKKAYVVWDTFDTNDKKILKSFNKTYDGPMNKIKEPYTCLGLQVFKTSKEKEKIYKDDEGDSSRVIAASSGTGFFVSTNGHMVTNNHVIDSCDMVKAHYKGKEIEADVLFTDRTNDLAIIKANIKTDKVFPVSNEDVSLLEDIIVAGYPLGKKVSASIKTSKGSVTALAGYGDNYSNFQIDAALNRGNSGGPIMDQKGNVVGVAVEVYGKEAGIESFNFGVKSSTLKTFASSNQFKFQDPSTEELSNKELGQLITEATIYLECWMSVAKIKQIIEEGEQQKAFFSEYK